MGRRLQNLKLPDIKIQTDTVITGDNGFITVPVETELFADSNVTVSSYEQDTVAFVSSFDDQNLTIGTSAPNCKVMYRIVSKRVI